MTWKIEIDSDNCPHLKVIARRDGKWELIGLRPIREPRAFYENFVDYCCHPNNFMKPCTEATCPVVGKHISREAAEQLVIALIMNLASHDRMRRDDAIDELSEFREILIAALTGKEE